MDTDEELYARVRAGDGAAFDALYERYEVRFFGYLRALLPSRADAEDAFHEAFLRALTGPEADFGGEGSFRAWLYRVGRNAALNRLRGEQRRARTAAQLWQETAAGAGGGLAAESADAALESRELAAALDGAVARLPPALLELFHLRATGLRYEEMASVLGVPTGTVKSRMHQLVHHLRKELEPWTA
jgi:RNA polymerase sigma-70 factor (ECF subfamily)